MKQPFRVFPLILLMLLVGLAPAADAEPEGTLRVATTTMPSSLVIHFVGELQEYNICWQLYDSLVWVDDEGNVVPALAERWDVSEDGREYTFYLRQGVTFHNGEAFNADAVIFSWEYGKEDRMRRSEKWKLVETMEKLDEYTVKMTSNRPNPLLLRVMPLYWTMLPPKYFAEVGEEGLLAHPVGTGPFQFVEWIKGDRIVLEANPNYWEAGLPKIKNLIYRPIPESATRVAAIQTGEVDIVTRLSAEEAESLQGNPDVRVLNYPVNRVYYLAFNNLTTGKGLPIEDPRVRQAMNYAVDVDAILKALFNGYGRPLTGFVTPDDLGYDPEIKPFGYDPDKALKLLAEAGYPDGFELDFACPVGAYAHFEQVCEAVQGYLEAVGIHANLEFMESGSYWNLEAKKELPPLFGDGWFEGTGEAYPRLLGALGGVNAAFSAWSDPAIDALLESIRGTIDDDARAGFYIELQRYMQENPPFIYLYTLVTFEAQHPKVQNYKPRSSELFYLKNTSLAQ